MATNTRHDHESTALEAGSHALPLLGVDQTGAKHYYSPEREYCRIVRAGHAEQDGDLPRDGLDAYINGVARERGWAQPPRESGFAALAEELAAIVEADR